MDTATLRAKLKADLGYNARAVTVKQNWSEYIFTIRDPAVDAERVRAWAAQYQKIDRDERTGEILCGGNVYVRVQYSADVRRVLVGQYAPAVAAAAAQLAPIDGHLIPINGTPYMLGRDGSYYALWGDHYLASGDIESLALMVAHAPA